MNSFQMGIVFSVAFYLSVGWFAGRKVKHIEDYFVAGRSAPTILILGTLIASFLSTNAFMGEVGVSYQGHAPLIITMTCMNCVGYVIGAIYFGRYLRRSSMLTVPAFFKARFGSQRIQRFAGFSIVTGLTAYLLAVTWGMALVISEVTALSSSSAIVLVWVSYTFFTLYSGSRGVILTDTIMFLLFSVMIVIAAFFIVDSAGGWYSSIEQLTTYEKKPGLISWHGRVGPDVHWKTPMDGLLWSVILGFAWGMVVAVSPWQTSRYLMAKSEHVVIRSACGALIMMLLLYLVTNFAASAVNLVNPDIDPPESTMIWVAQNLLPTLLGSLLICGVLAAGLSSASTFLSLVGFSVSHDIFGNSDLGQAGDKSGASIGPTSNLRSARLSMLLVGIIVIILALALPRDIFWITYFAGPLFASSWGAVAFMSVWSQTITETGAFWGMVIGFSANVLMNILSLTGLVDWAIWLDPILISAIASYFSIIVISRSGKVTSHEREYRKSLHNMPIEEIDVNQVKLTLMWPRFMILLGICIAIALTVFYAIPYHRAVVASNILSEPSLVNGEIILAVGYGMMLIGSGIWVWQRVQQDYGRNLK